MVLVTQDAGATPLVPVKVPMPLRFRPEHRWSDDELLAFCAANEPMQIERESDGTIVMMTPAGYNGNRRENYIGRELDFWAERDRRGEAFGCNAGFSLSDGSVLSPDAGWISAVRLRDVPRTTREKYLPRCPEFVIEVLSERFSFRRRGQDATVARQRRGAWLAD